MKLFISTLAVTAGLTTASLAADPLVCMPAAEMEAALVDWYGEEPVSKNRSKQEQLWMSQTTGTWSMIEYRQSGTACVLAQGKDWAGSRNMLLAQLQN